MMPPGFMAVFQTIQFISWVLAILMLVCMWIIFKKCGQPGWASVIPVYNLVALCRCGGLSGWWTLGVFVPLLNLFAWFYIMLRLAQRFGKGAGFAVGLFLLGFIFLPILAFGKSQPAA